MKRLLLVNPPQTYLSSPGVQPPIGLLYIAATVREWTDWSVEVIDCSGDDADEVAGIVEDCLTDEGDVIGFTCVSLDIPIVNDIAAELKNEGCRAKLIVGGVGATLSWDHLDGVVWDHIFVGEAELAVPEFLRGLEAGAPQDWIILCEPPNNLDELPLPARDLLVVQGGNIWARGRKLVEGTSSVVLTARGCPNNCAFCSARAILRRLKDIKFGLKTLRKRNVNEVRREIELARDELNIRSLRFSDETFNADANRLEALCAALKDAGVLWRVSCRTRPSNVGMWARMRDAGCREVSFGVECADQRVLDLLDKRATVEDAAKAIKDAREAGLTVRALFMVGLPGETDETMELNKRFFKENPADLVSLTRFMPLPGTPIWNEPWKFGARLLVRDLKKYNFMTYCKDEENKIHDIIEYSGIPAKDVARHIAEMRQFLTDEGLINHG